MVIQLSPKYIVVVLSGITFCFLFVFYYSVLLLWKLYSCYSGRFDIWNLFLFSYFLRKEVADALRLQGIYMRLASVLQSDFN